MGTDFIRAPSKASLLAMLKSAREIDPRLLRSLFDGVIFKSEMIGYLAGGGADHGELSGLTDDDHTQYGRTDGTRAITGLQTFNAGIATDTIAEKTAATGVTIDSLLIQDGNIAAVDYAFVTANDIATDVTSAELEELSDASSTALHTHADIGDGPWLPLAGGDVIGATTFGDGGTTNYSEFETDGDLVLNGTANIAAVDYSFVTANDAATGVTAAELEELTDTSVTTLHAHAVGDHEHVTTSLPFLCFSNYVDIKARNAVYSMHGGLHNMDTGSPLNTDPTDIVVAAGSAKIMVVVNAGSDLDGEITVTGTTVNRDTGAETGADTDTLTVDALTTDASDTDASSNARYSFTGAYITSKWFKGTVTLSTVDLTLTDVDTYCVAFEQFNDTPVVTITTLDITAKATNANAWLYSYLYTLKVTGDKCNIARVASLDLPAAEVTANVYYRLRRGALAIAIDGTTDGIWLDVFPGPLASAYWEDMNFKVWATLETEGDTTGDPILSSNFWNWEDYEVAAGVPDNIYATENGSAHEVADDTLTIGTFSIATLGYTKTYNMTAGSSTAYSYVQLPNQISSGSFRMEVLCGHLTDGTATELDIYNHVLDVGSASFQNRVGHGISKNNGNPRHRGWHTTGGSGSTPIDTTNTGAWVDADSIGWTLCQFEWNYSTRVLKTEFTQLDSGHTTGQEVSSQQSALGAPMEFARFGLREGTGGTGAVYVAQVWVGSASTAWPDGKLNGVG